MHADVGVDTWAVLAKSNEEAKREGVNVALEKWPEDDGWVGHKASVAEISQGALSQALSVISGEADEASGEIELIM